MLNELLSQMSKDMALPLIRSELLKMGLDIIETNSQKPWGIEFKVQETQSLFFLETFFERDTLPIEVVHHPFGPKILVIEPSKRLS